MSEHFIRKMSEPNVNGVTKYSLPWIEDDNSEYAGASVAVFKCRCGVFMIEPVFPVSKGNIRCCGCRKSTRESVDYAYDKSHPLMSLFERVVLQHPLLIDNRWRLDKSKFFILVSRLAAEQRIVYVDVPFVSITRKSNKDILSEENMVVKPIDFYKDLNKEPRWLVYGEWFHTEHEAAIVYGVSRENIRTWCRGITRQGMSVPPLEDCDYIMPD